MNSINIMLIQYLKPINQTHRHFNTNTYFSFCDCFVSSTSAPSYLIWKLSNCDGKCPGDAAFSVAISSWRNSSNAFSPDLKGKTIHRNNYSHVIPSNGKNNNNFTRKYPEMQPTIEVM